MVDPAFSSRQRLFTRFLLRQSRRYNPVRDAVAYILDLPAGWGLSSEVLEALTATEVVSLTEPILQLPSRGIGITATTRPSRILMQSCGYQDCPRRNIYSVPLVFLCSYAGNTKARAIPAIFTHSSRSVTVHRHRSNMSTSSICRLKFCTGERLYSYSKPQDCYEDTVFFYQGHL